MPVKLSTEAADLVRSCVLDNLPVSREGFNAACRKNRLLGRPDGRAVSIASNALEKVGVEGLLALAHVDHDFIPVDHDKAPVSSECEAGRHDSCPPESCSCYCHPNNRIRVRT